MTVVMVCFCAMAQSPESVIAEGDSLYMNYDFDGARRMYGKYKTLVRKNKRAATENVLDDRMRRLDMAENFLSGIEKLVIVDSISMPEEDFFTAFRLSRSAGSLVPVSDTEIYDSSSDILNPAFCPEDASRIYWTQEVEADSVLPRRMVIMESVRLSDGSLSHGEKLDFGMSGNQAYPFMMSDGSTFYFASDGPESIGGYDIFVASRDSSTGEFLSPGNLGFPYNSPANDYMLAIDEENGVGWWATDRNSDPGEVTVYMFLAPEMRENYDPEDDDDLADVARIYSYRATWGDSDYSDLRDRMRNFSPDDGRSDKDFEFRLPGKRVLTKWEELKDPDAKKAMEAYLEEKARFDGIVSDLKSMRRRYHSRPDSGLASAIKEAEESLELSRNSLRNLRNEVYMLIK